MKTKSIRYIIRVLIILVLFGLQAFNTYQTILLKEKVNAQEEQLNKIKTNVKNVFSNELSNVINDVSELRDSFGYAESDLEDIKYYLNMP